MEIDSVSRVGVNAAMTQTVKSDLKRSMGESL